MARGSHRTQARARVDVRNTSGFDWVWQFGLYTVDDKRTRLVSRSQVRPQTVWAWLFTVLALEPAAFHDAARVTRPQGAGRGARHRAGPAHRACRIGVTPEAPERAPLLPVRPQERPHLFRARPVSPLRPPTSLAALQRARPVFAAVRDSAPATHRGRLTTRAPSRRAPHRRA
jgi:hypothetical protein